MESATVPVRHLDIGGVFETTNEIYRKCFGPVWVIALLILIPTAIIEAILGNDGILGIVSALVHLFATALLAGSIVRVAQQALTEGELKMGVGEVIGSVMPLLISLVLLNIVFGILVGIGLLLLIVPGVILMLMWVVSTPAMVVEGQGVFDSLGRSTDLTRDNRMRILGLGILILLLYFGLFAIAGLITAMTPVLGVILLIILGVLLYPYISIIATVLYFHLLEVKEGISPTAAGSGAGAGGGAVVVEETVVVEEEIVEDDRPPEPPRA